MSEARAPDNSKDTVTIVKDGDWFVATDESTGVASQGKTRPEALAMLAEAIELHESPLPADVDEESLESSDAPWF
ncbi:MULTISPECIES: type II toxin-antitoxin system HicB family antitoxin [Haloferax]|uniref:Type II toxin-antitoxin system HicB family antitoxin n=1 Tax=Haloferax marinum TaxID=2666143 RepID=A0A6A8G386_9EURY|nr:MULTISPECIES: type II toxin-antitoxin system HicB family antitoxin [Haloferax]KAB1196052.1 type II toxin-antitoxin system HicB family antitoxin [Haloferax sp. CBA1150]MRW95032.1 type II toxin-antitoxin system HicB family antitoxin [Haloferax marinum]